jgi:hypothetical protein
MINNVKSLFIVYLSFRPIPTLALPLKGREFYFSPFKGEIE